MVPRSRFETYEKAYDGLTQAVARAKLICKHTNVHCDILGSSASRKESILSRKRGRPKGSKSAKPLIKVAEALIGPSNRSNDDSVCESGCSLNDVRICQDSNSVLRLEPTLDEFHFEEVKDPLIRLDIDSKLIHTIGRVDYPTFLPIEQESLEDRTSIHSGTTLPIWFEQTQPCVPACWNFPLP